MKLKFWQWEFDFDKEDAKTAIPVILLLLGLAYTQMAKEVLWGGTVIYYFLYFFLDKTVATVTSIFTNIRRFLFFRCPYCSSREIVLQGYQEYHSDELYAYYLCNRCRETSILVNDSLIKTTYEQA